MAYSIVFSDRSEDFSMMNWKKGVKELEEEITELKEDEEEILNQDAGILVNF